MIRVHVLFLILILVPILADGQETERKNETVSLQTLSWLAGSWSSINNKGTETEENWSSPKAGLMLGTNRTVRANGKTAFEFLRLVQEGNKITYFASPGGKPPTPFVLTESSANRAVFENIYHDFPQRIIYERDKNQLHAQIAGTVNGVERSVEWNLKKFEDSNDKQAGNPDLKQPAFQGLRTALYKVNDIDLAKQWYTNALGIEPYFDQPFYVGFNVGGFELGLDPDLKGVTVGNNQPVYWGVTDCAASYRRLLELGAKEQAKPKDVGDGVVAATVVDPFGNSLGIIQNPHFKIKQ